MTYTWRNDPWLMFIERLRGFLIAVGLMAAGVVIALRGSGWGFLLAVVGVVFGLWVMRWPTSKTGPS